VKILTENRTTGAYDLIQMLRGLGMNGQKVAYTYQNPPSIQKLMEAGPMIIACGINSSGTIMPLYNPATGKMAGKIRHWVVLLNLLPVGNTALAQVYNPYQNRLEVVWYGYLPESNGNLETIEVTR
jgi:hypothetical protein